MPNPTETQVERWMFDLTKTQVERWYRKLWAKITRGDGYQPFGYDLPTMKINHPGFLPALKRLSKLWEIAK